MIINNWKLNYKEHKNLEGTVPCSLYSILLDNNLIDDPYYRTNEYEIRELSRDGCEMHTTFNADNSILSRKNIFLKFDGLDTICEVFLNDIKVGNANNMHRTWLFDIKNAISPGENSISIRFHSPVEYIEKMDARHYLWGVNEAMKGYPHIRKPHCMFGWDWGPQLPDMGISRCVELIAYDDARIHDFYVSQKHSGGRVALNISLEADEYTRAYAAVTSPDGETIKAEFKTTIDGSNAEIFIESPLLWWPNGYGSQPLYTVEVTTYSGKRIADTMKKRIGLRTLTVSTAADEWGNEFCFVINGEKIFSMGADYIPEDCILSRTNRDRTESLIKACTAANYNTIRIWGGGQYPTDYFYDLCDENGLIVWQDFMVACANILLSDEFEKNIVAEATDNIKRLRNHPSLGLFCGNNEMEIAMADWGVGKSAKVRNDYLRLYEKLLPDLCERYAPDTFYWPASPSSGGGFDNPNSHDSGDVHYWDVWHGNKPFEDYRNYYFRYCSEFGFESFPSIKTIKTFAEAEDMNPFSPVMESHQKCNSGNAKILIYASANYLYATNFEALVYASQLLQADAIKYGVEHFRRFRGHCMGAVYWQLNDCWPVASWASVDYFGRWKALHYAAKKFFAPILLSAHEKNAEVVLNLSNETLSSFKGKAVFGVYTTDFEKIYEDECSVDISKLSSKDIAVINCKEHLDGKENERFFAMWLYDSHGNLISNQSLLFVKPKAFKFKNPEISVQITRQGTQVIFDVSSDTYAKGVELDFENLDMVLSDNYFDITSKENIIITAESDQDIERLNKELKIKSVYDIR